MSAAPTYAERLDRAVRESGSLLCLGLDPDGIGIDAVESFCLAALEAVLPHVAAVKPNLAFFEQHGVEGRRVLERVRERIPGDRLVIVDGKRGDIGSTSAAYARALFDGLGADAVTVNPLMGRDSVAPFLDRPGCGAYLLARTSNPGAADLLDQRLAGGEALYERVVRLGREWDPGGAVGFVVGATAPDAVRRVRAAAGEAPLLLPGVGAQGGALEESVAAGVDGARAGLLIAVSRGVTAAPDGPGAAAAELRSRIEAARRAAAR